MSDLTARRLTSNQARKLCDQIVHEALNLSELLTQLRDGEGWVALGYASWAACCETEFGYSKQHANRLIKSDQIRKQLVGSGGEVEPIGSTLSESQARELTNVPESSRVEVIQAAHEVAESEGRKMTAKDIKEAADAAKVTPEIVDEDEDKDGETPQADYLPEDFDEKPTVAQSDNPAWDAIAEEGEDIAATIGNKGRMADFLDCIAEQFDKHPAVAYARLSNLATKIRKANP